MVYVIQVCWQLAGFIMRIYHDARPLECQNRFTVDHKTDSREIQNQSRFIITANLNCVSVLSLNTRQNKISPTYKSNKSEVLLQIYVGLHVRWTLILSNFHQNQHVLTYFSKSSKYEISQKSVVLFLSDIMRLTAAFHSCFANTNENGPTLNVTSRCWSYLTNFKFMAQTNHLVWDDASYERACV